MSGDIIRRLTWSAGLASVATGLLLTASSISQMNSHISDLAEYSKRSASLQKTEADVSHRRAAVASFEELSNKQPVPMDQFLAEMLSDQKYDTQEKTAETLSNGWRLRRTEISFQQIELKALTSFLTACEQGRPAWRLSECSIRAQEKDGSTVQARLVVEALEKSS